MSDFINSLKIFKYFISSDGYTQDPGDESLAWKGCVAIVVAKTQEEADGYLRAHAAERGVDIRWALGANLDGKNRAATVLVLEVAPGVKCTAAV